MAEEKEKYRNISTKVKPETKKLLAKICKKRKTNEYEFLQNVCDCVVRYTSDKYNLTPELERIMGIFEHLEGWHNAFNLADHNAEAEICEAFYVLKAKGKNGLRVIHVERPWWDGVSEWKQSVNVQDMLERFLDILMPERYLKMRKLSIALGIESRTHLLDYMIEHCTEEEANAQYRREFEDAARAENAKTIEYGQKTKSTHHHSPEEFIEQGVIMFEPEDTPSGFDGLPEREEREGEDVAGEEL
jgi:hypothetical protein